MSAATDRSGTRKGSTHTDSAGQAHRQALAVAIQNGAARRFDLFHFLLLVERESPRTYVCWTTCSWIRRATISAAQTKATRTNMCTRLVASGSMHYALDRN